MFAGSSQHLMEGLQFNVFSELEIQRSLETEARQDKSPTPPFITASPIRNDIVEENWIVRTIKQEQDIETQDHLGISEQQHTSHQRSEALEQTASYSSCTDTQTIRKSVVHLIHHQAHYIITKSNPQGITIRVTNIHTCKICGITSPTLEAVIEHIRTDCLKSEREVTETTHSTKHGQTQNGMDQLKIDETQICKICNRQLRNKNSLILHQIIHDKPRRIPCKFCKQEFTSWRERSLHMLEHTNKPRLNCSICDKNFASRQCWSRHRLIHNMKRKHSCTICQADFTRLDHLHRHQLKHDTIKQYSCHICGLSTNSSKSMNKHMHKHTKNV